jgi:hypothetical protein
MHVLIVSFAPATIAAAAVSVALPYIADLGKEVAKSAAGEAGKAIREWVKGKLASDAGKEVVKDLEVCRQWEHFLRLR